MAKTLGEQLKSIRESRGISLEEIANKTHIRLVYLKALESGDTDQLTSGSQRGGFLRLYASELGVVLEGGKVRGLQQESEMMGEGFHLEGPGELEKSEVKTPKCLLNEINNKEPQSTWSEPEIKETKKTKRNEIVSHSIQAHSSEVFSEIGETLHQQRERLSLSLNDIQEHTHIRLKFLTALEKGDFAQLPSSVQTKGMLVNYAEFLNVDVDEILLKYADGLQRRRLENSDIPKQNQSGRIKTLSTTRLKLKNFFSLDLLIIAALFIGFGALVIWGVNRILRENAPGTSPTGLPEVADILLATASPTPQESPGLDENTIETDQTQDVVFGEPTPLFTSLPNDNPINIVIIPKQRVWVRVIADGEMVFEGRMLPGNAYDFSGEEILEINTGNAGALQIFFNEEDLGAPGLSGQVMNLLISENGLVLPTPTNSPTITATSEVTLTPTPSPTPSQTPELTNIPTETND